MGFSSAFQEQKYLFNHWMDNLELRKRMVTVQNNTVYSIKKYFYFYKMSPLRHIFLQLYKVPCLHLQNSATGYFNNVISRCQNMLSKNFLWHLIFIKIYVAF